MKTRLLLLAACAGLMLHGCASQDAQVLQQKNQKLEKDLNTANEQITRMKQTEAELRDRISDLQHTTSVLTTEKTSRVEESSSLRGQVRKFVQNNIDGLKAFMVQGNLLDYVGSELVPRLKQGKEPIFIVDFANPMPSSGVMTGVGGVFTQPGNFLVKVLHPVGTDYVVTWESKLISIEQAGKQQVQFPVSVGFEKGDVIGYYFPQTPNVGYDGPTGETLYADKDVALGGTISKSFMSGATERRAYSLGIYGLLDAR